MTTVTDENQLAMMKRFLVLSALVAVTLSINLDHVDEGTHQWELFKIEHQKEYNSVEEEELRKNTFIDNLKFVNEHNAKYENGEVTFNVEINKFADMSAKEFGQMMRGLRVPAGHKRTVSSDSDLEDLDLPKSVDWRKKGAVTPVKEQGKCVSDWAFSVVGTLEGQVYLKNKKNLTSLSAQNVIDCSKPQGNHGCGGGISDYSYMYIRDNKGIDVESVYPYEAKDGKCRYNLKNIGATITGYVSVDMGSEKALQKAVAKTGPVAAAIDADHQSFQLYKNGVYTEPSCSSSVLSHGVLAVGYGTDKAGGPYWLVKNSWGTSWGMEGYIMMARNKNNMCGIASWATYPTV